MTPVDSGLTRFALKAFSAVSLWVLVMPLLAQTTLDAEELRRRTQRETEERQRQQQAPDVHLQPLPTEVGSLELPIEKDCFRINSLQLEGARISEFTWAQHYLDQYIARCVGVESINLIQKRLANQIIARGYITTRVGIPEQDLSSGTLKFVVVPGIIRQIRFDDESTLYSWKTAFPARPGDLLNLRDLEQGLEQMKRVPTQDIDMQLVPGEQPGESDVVISAKRSPRWRAVISADDAGTKFTGRLQTSFNFAIDNLLGLNDLFNIGFNTDTERDGSLRGTRGNNVFYSVPWGYWTFFISGSTYNYHQTVQGATQSFVSSGNSENIEFKVQRLVFRDQTRKASLQLRVDKRYSSSFINDTEIEVQRRHTTSAELALLYRHYVGVIQIDLNLAHREGVRWFGGQMDVSERSSGAPTFPPTFQYALQTLDASVIVPFKLEQVVARYLGSFRGQTTTSPLYASEFFSIGNRYTVRGFDGEQTLAAERGWYLRNEVEFALGRTGQAFYAGVDHGEVHGPSSNLLVGQRLTGAVLGLRGGIRGFAYDVFVGAALQKPNGFQTSQPSVGFQLSYQF